MSTPLVVPSFSFRALAGCMVLAVAVAASGCAEVVASSKRPRESGNKAFAAGEYTDAAGAYRQAVQTDPLDYRAWYGLGQAYDATKSYHQAIQAYRTALDVRLRTLPGKEDEAMRVRIIDALGKSIAAGNDRGFAGDPPGGSKHPSAQEKYIAAKAFQYLGDADSAIDAYQQASLLDKKDLAIARDFGLYLEKIPAMQEQAVKQLKRAYTLDPKDQQVVAALRRNGIVPGPSLKDVEQLARPSVPKGPLPEIDIKKWQEEQAARAAAAAKARAAQNAGYGTSFGTAAGATPASGTTAAGPRD